MARNKPLIYLSVAVVVATTIGVAPSEGKNQALEIIKYFNPIPEKNAYLNQSQDRIIKKKKFKVADIPGAQPVANREIGLFAQVTPAQIQDQALITKLLDDPKVNGLSAILPWRMLQTDEDTFNWKPVDELLKLCSARKKTLILRVSTCGIDNSAVSDTPDWVLSDAEVKSVEYIGTDGKPHKMPIYWNTAYLAKWGNFVAEMGDKYDKNEWIHSIGVTGGGVGGSTKIVPHFSTTADKSGESESNKRFKALNELLKKDHGMNNRQLVEHWKYVADMYPKAFPTARLNFDIDPPTPNRAGQDSLDEISDYLVYRYGQRVYLTRQDVADAKHGFDQYRVLLKFKPDTLTGYQLTPSITTAELAKLTSNALQDGISFAEIPADMLVSSDQSIAKSLNDLRSKLGYQVVSKGVSIPKDLKAGEPLKASFNFVNIGAASPMRPSRELDKDVSGSYKVQIELRDANGKPVVRSLHTPEVPTHKWVPGQPISYQEELKMPSTLKPGQYTVWLSMVEPDSKRLLQVLDASSANGETKVASAVDIGKIEVVK